jgi:hypothetical protein
MGYHLAVQLSFLADPLAALGFPKHAVILLGAAEAEIGNMGADERPVTQPEIDKYTSITQNQLGEKVFQEAWKQGQRMTIHDAADYALNDVGI